MTGLESLPKNWFEMRLYLQTVYFDYSQPELLTRFLTKLLLNCFKTIKIKLKKHVMMF